MKKQKFNKKLSLNKESIANLNSLEMDKVKGGADISKYKSCYVHCVTASPEVCDIKVI